MSMVEKYQDRRLGDTAFADLCVKEAARLRLKIENHGWDGQWYRRAYFDEGTPLGASDNLECRMDSIAQSRSVPSRAADPERSRMAWKRWISTSFAAMKARSLPL
jgi:cellobiose phosphorylase